MGSSLLVAIFSVCLYMLICRIFAICHSLSITLFNFSKYSHQLLGYICPNKVISQDGGKSNFCYLKTSISLKKKVESKLPVQ